MPTTKNSPVVEVYKGVNIRKCNIVRLRLGVVAYKKILDIVESSGLSIQKVIAYSGKPCERCKDVDVIVFNKAGEEKKIKRGIVPIPQQNSGGNIIEKNFKIHAKSSRTGKENK